MWTITGVQSDNSEIVLNQPSKDGRCEYLLEFLFKTITPKSTLLDLGCGPKRFSEPLKSICSKVVTVDAFPSVNPDILMDVETEDISKRFKENEFDYILVLDFIEHLDKANGVSLIEKCKKICRKSIFLLTPREWDDNSRAVTSKTMWSYNNEFCLHKSLWTPQEFPDWKEHKVTSFKHYYFGEYIKENN